MPSRTISSDPRTIARSIPGVTDILFPRVGYGLSTLLNRRAVSIEEVEAVPNYIVAQCSLKPAMLSEIGIARAEQLVQEKAAPDWDKCIDIAVRRQRRHFNARRPESLSDLDATTAEKIGRNLYIMMRSLPEFAQVHGIRIAPRIPGYQWIASGIGDFAIGDTLIEVKCTWSEFGSADFRQVLMYWILSYAFAIELEAPIWSNIAFINPRINRVLRINYLELVRLASGGLSSVEVIELFSSVAGDYALKEMAEFRM